MAITNKDVEKLKEVFATKDDLNKLKEVFVTKEEFRFELAKLETKDDAARRHNEVMNKLDSLMKEKETAREDRIIAIAKDREQDRRLGVLEQKVGVV